MTAHPPIVLQCIDRAVLRGGSIVFRAGSAAVEALQKDSQRHDALRELERRLPGWRARFGEMLRRTLDNPEPAATLAVHPSSLTLTLVDDAQIVQDIESTRLAQQIASKIERPLAELDALMSSALGLEGIRPDENPLRPAVFAQALARMLAEDEPHPEWPGLWMRGMADVFTEELAQFYPECCALLLKSGVQAAAYRMVNRPGGVAPQGVRDSRPTPLREVSQPAPLESGAAPFAHSSGFAQAISAFMQLAQQALRGPFVRDFLAHDAPQVHQPLPPAWHAQLRQELAQLNARGDEALYDPDADLEYEAMAPVERPQRNVGTDSPLTRGAWGEYGAPRRRALVRTQLKSEAQEVGQAIAVDLVRQLLDQVAQDPRLLAPVREAMVALEPALGRLALRSPRFFGERDNAARKLLEQVAERSFRYNDQFASEFQPFFDGVRDRFNALNEQEALADAQPFEQALAQLQGEWAEHDRQDEAHKQQLLAAVQSAEQRQEDADRIAWELGQRSDLEGAPGVVQDFLFERWSLVMAHARGASAQGELDPGGYVGVITDLLWSVKKDCALREPARAFELIPRVVMKLRDGLIRIGQPPGDDDVFFKALERLHRPVMKLRAKHRKQALDTGAAPLQADDEIDLAPAEAHKPRAADETWLSPRELKACGFADTEIVQPVARTAAISAQEADKLLAALTEGCWVDLYARRRWRRAQLTWASSKGTLFMFVSHGGRPHSMTRRSLQRLLASRLVRPVARHEVVQHAIDALAKPKPQALAA